MADFLTNHWGGHASRLLSMFTLLRIDRVLRAINNCQTVRPRGIWTANFVTIFSIFFLLLIWRFQCNMLLVFDNVSRPVFMFIWWSPSSPSPLCREAFRWERFSIISNFSYNLYLVLSSPTSAFFSSFFSSRSFSFFCWYFLCAHSISPRFGVWEVIRWLRAVLVRFYCQLRITCEERPQLKTCLDWPVVMSIRLSCLMIDGGGPSAL